MKDILEFATPEEVGILSESIRDFIKDITERQLMTHSFIIIRHGKVCAECYCPPFKVNELHRMYSTSKSFASMAMGILIGDGKVHFDDKVSDYFPEYRTENMHEWIENTTVRDALMMATSHTQNPYVVTDDNYVSKTFTVSPDHPSGTVFNYDTNASNCIGAIVEKVTGKPFLEFLKERALNEIGFSKDAHCLEMPQGGSWGGSAVMCSTRDLARFALLVYNDGIANGKELLPRDYVIQAKSFQIDNCMNGHKDHVHGHGYGYQIWRTSHNGYAFLGMGNQCAFFFPDYDIIYCMTSDTQGSKVSYGHFEPLWYNVVKNAKEEKLPENKNSYNQLIKEIESFRAPTPNGKSESKYAALIDNVSFKANKNTMGITDFKLTFDNDGGVFHYNTVRGDKEIPFSFGKYKYFEFPETEYPGKRMNYPSGKKYRSMSAAAWVEEHKLVIRTYLIDDYLGNLNIVISLKNNTATLSMIKTAEGFLNEYQGEAVGTRE